MCKTSSDLKEEIVTDDDGAVFALVENRRMMVKVPNVKTYRIPEDVYRMAFDALDGCTELEVLDVPYKISVYELEEALEHCKTNPCVRHWNWAYDSKRSEMLERAIAQGWCDEQGFVYSQDRKRLLRAALIGDEYWIPEGVERIERLAFIGCRFETLHVPYTCRLDQVSEDDYPIFGSERVAGCVIEWDKPYEMEDEITNSLCINDYEGIIEKDFVRYSHNMKRLLEANIDFNENKYEVPDGVETICDMAFAFCPKHLTLIIPHSVKVIGENVFGPNGGSIIIR